MEDARFEDADEQPVRLRAEDVDDLKVLSTLVQDAVLQSADISWMPKKHRLALLLNRFRWEDREAAERAGRKVERVRAMLVVESALKVTSNGVDPADKDLILSVLTIGFVPGEDGAGRLELTLSGDGVLAVDAECLDVTLTDVSRPYLAPSGKTPHHPTD